MARNEYVGKRLSITLDQEIFALLEQDSKKNCLKPSTRVAQIVSQYLIGELSVKPTNAAVQEVPQAQEQAKQEEVQEVKAEPKEECELSQLASGIDLDSFESDLNSLQL